MYRRTFLLLSILVLTLGGLVLADSIVQLNVNRPYNDVNEHFISFAVRPEDLYEALDGPNRKSLTAMAAMMGDAHLKFVGDFYFAASSDRKFRNPTKIIWKGFNRWTRAVNWTMIIPVPYSPSGWDSVLALKILNTSYMVGITDCIWQLGTDFGTSRAKDYVTELDTLKLMVDAFRPYVDDWRIMGADISAGSSVEETKRYVELSKDLNTAYGWTQPPNVLPKTSLGSYIFGTDPALRSLLSQRVPVWLSVPPRDRDNSLGKRLAGDETTDALRWAQTLGDAASSGFDVIFKHMTLSDWERPSYSFYVTALFKKVMGSRVFPARPLNVFAPTNKLYTHCASAVSGGIAFMVVNTEDQPLTITVRSMNKLASTGEFWQYALTSERGRIMLNNGRLYLNSTLRPQIKLKSPEKPLQLVTPSMSVSFWVLPKVNLEHCQFTEIEAEDVSHELLEEREKPRDKLLQKLIEESSVSRSSLQSAINRNRRFVLEDQNEPQSFLQKLLQPFNMAPDPPVSVPAEPKKRKAAEEPALPVRRREALSWLRHVLDQTRDVASSSFLKRRARSAENYSGPLFYNKHGKKSTFTKKITEIRRPERKTKPIFDLSEFDEEEFFKKIDEQSEPEYIRPPEGDVHMKVIESMDDDEEETDATISKKKPTSKKNFKIVDQSVDSDGGEEKSGGILPTEFYEALPSSIFKPHKPINIGAALNSLLFPEPFSKKISKDKVKAKSLVPKTEVNSDVEELRGTHFPKGNGGRLAEDFLQVQKELGKKFLSHIAQAERKKTTLESQQYTGSLELTTELAPKLSSSKTKAKQKLKSSSKRVEYINDDIKNYFKDDDEVYAKSDNNKSNDDRKESVEQTKSWWDLTSLRRKRALSFDIAENSLHTNMIDKEDDLIPLGQVLPEDRRYFQYHVSATTDVITKSIMETTEKPANGTKGKDTTFPDKLMAAVKSKVSKFMNIITRHVNEWYNTLTKHAEAELVGQFTTTVANPVEMTTLANIIQ